MYVQVPSRAALRALLGELFKSDQDFDAFLVDWFFHIKQRTSTNMDRVAKTNLLFEQVNPEELWNALKLSCINNDNVNHGILDRVSAFLNQYNRQENSHRLSSPFKSEFNLNSRAALKGICLFLVASMLFLIILEIVFKQKISLRNELPSSKTSESYVAMGMILIPSGQFTMGSNSGEPAERPPHAENVKEFYLDRTEVTVDAYRKCV